MNKKLKIVIGIIIGAICLYGIIFTIDYNRCSNMKEPIFAIHKEKNNLSNKTIVYQGLGYKVKVEKNVTKEEDQQITKVEMYMFDQFITGAITDIENEENNKENKVASKRIVMINNKLYYDTGKESTIKTRCGNMDGSITSNISPNDIPTINNQSNFEGEYGYQGIDENTIEIKIDNKWIVFKTKEELETEEILTAVTLEDEIVDNTIWCGTFQLIWNDLRNDLAKQDIVFKPQIKVVENLNKQTFTTKDLSDKYYYKKVGTPSIALKEEIEKAIKDKFNETSDILDDFKWNERDPKDYFLYTMLKKEFKFEKEFEELEKGTFGNYSDVNYFGIKASNESNELRGQVQVLYYNSKEDFAIKLKTKQEDEVILCKNAQGNTFNEIYKKIQDNEQKYTGKSYIEEGELVKIPNIKLKEKTEFTELENKLFYFSNGDAYEIEKALQTIEFELDRTGGKIKSEAGMMVEYKSAMIVDEIRDFSINDTFTIFLKEKGKDNPYFAGKISDITKFQ